MAASPPTKGLFRQESKGEAPLARDQKMELLAKLENKSKREAEKIVLKESSDPAALRGDRVKAVSEEKVEFRFTAGKELVGKIEKIKGLLAHRQPDPSIGALVDQLCDIALKKLDPAQSPTRRARGPQMPGHKAPNQQTQTRKARTSKAQDHDAPSGEAPTGEAPTGEVPTGEVPDCKVTEAAGATKSGEAKPEE
ncbi:MAG: hypothetical protein C5B49_11515, partial [Bdellovibrio sp.]